MKRSVVVSVLTVAAAVLVFALMSTRKERAVEAEPEGAVKAPSRVSVDHGETVVSLDAATQQKSATGIVALEPTIHQSEQRAAIPISLLAGVYNEI